MPGTGLIKEFAKANPCQADSIFGMQCHQVGIEKEGHPINVRQKLSWFRRASFGYRTA